MIMAFESMSIARSQCFEIYQYGGVGFPPPPIGGSMIDKKGTAVSEFSLFVAWGEVRQVSQELTLILQNNCIIDFSPYGLRKW